MPKVTTGTFGKKRVSMRPEMAESGYVGNEYAVPSHDERGHGVRVSTMVTPAMKREVELIMAKQTIPELKTEGDLLRYALHRTLTELNKKLRDPDVRDAHGRMTAFVIAQRKTHEDRYWGDIYIPDTRLRLIQSIKRGDWIPAAEVLKGAEDSLDLVESAYWQDKIEEQLVIPFQHVKAKAKIQLLKLEKKREERRRKREKERGKE